MRILISIGLLCCGLCYGRPALAQELQGRVMDSKGQALPYASIWITGSSKGTSSNETGHFSLSLAGTRPLDSLVVAMLGYTSEKRPLSGIPAGQPIELRLSALPQQLEGVTVRARRPISEEFAVQRLDALDIYQNPTANADPLKAIEILPSATTVDESASPSLRGSSAQRSRIILNGVPVHNPVKFGSLDHIGSFSLFHTNMVQNEYVYAGNPPLSYGNVTAGLVEIETISSLSRSGVELSAALGNAGAMLSQKLGTERNFVQVYGNLQYGAPVLALNAAALPRVQSYGSYDVGLNLHLAPGPHTQINLYSYFIDEQSDYIAYGMGFEGQALGKKQRHFSILSLRHQKNRTLWSLNLGADLSREQMDWGNMAFRPKTQQYYASTGYKRLFGKASLQVGASGEYARFNLNHSCMPRYAFALSPQSPSFEMDSTVGRAYVETYVYGKWEPSSVWTLSGGLRGGLQPGERPYLSTQLSAKYHLSSTQSLLFSAGRYHGRSLPGYFQWDYLPQSSWQLAVDYQWKGPQTGVQAALYYKEEQGVQASGFMEQSEQRRIAGLELFAEQRFWRQWTVSGSYTFLHSREKQGGAMFPGQNSLPFMAKLTLSYQKLSVGTFALSYVGRSGLWFTPIEGGFFMEDAAAYAPIMGAQHSERYTAYHRVNFTANKLFPVGKTTLIVFVAINNILNRANESQRAYTADYQCYSFDYYQGRLFYFGVMIGL